MVTIGRGPAVTWQVLKHGENAAGLQAFRYRFGDSGNFAGFLAIGTIADHQVSAF
jgi:hypothetical protein